MFSPVTRYPSLASSPPESILTAQLACFQSGASEVKPVSSIVRANPAIGTHTYPLPFRWHRWTAIRHHAVVWRLVVQTPAPHIDGPTHYISSHTLLVDLPDI